MKMKPRYRFDKLLETWNSGFSIRLFRNDIWFCEFDQIWQIKWVLFFVSYRDDNDEPFSLLSFYNFDGYPRVTLRLCDMRLTLGVSYIYEYTDR